MINRSPQIIDMTADGQFRTAPRPVRAPLGTRLVLGAIVLAVVAGGLALAALAFWVALIMIPVTFVAAMVAYGLFRFQIWRARSSFGRQRDILRP